MATFGTFALLYTVTERFILPYTPTSDQPFLRSLIDLALPFMICYLLLFYIIFGKVTQQLEAITDEQGQNVYATLSRSFRCASKTCI